MIMTVHEKPVGATVEWYTPPDLFDALGLIFDLDPASPVNLPHWIPAAMSATGWRASVPILRPALLHSYEDWEPHEHLA